MTHLTNVGPGLDADLPPVDPQCELCHDSRECPTCDGAGETRGHRHSFTGILPCRDCKGSGRCDCQPTTTIIVRYY